MGAQCADTNYSLATQAEVYALEQTGCTSVRGYLEIYGNGPLNLDGLVNLTSVGASLYIVGFICTLLMYLGGTHHNQNSGNTHCTSRTAVTWRAAGPVNLELAAASMADQCLSRMAQCSARQDRS